jgi:hypothetical protein
MAGTAASAALLRAVRQIDAADALSAMEQEELRGALRGARGTLVNTLQYPPRRAEDRAAVRAQVVELRGGRSLRLGALDVDNALQLRCAPCRPPTLPRPLTPTHHSPHFSPQSIAGEKQRLPPPPRSALLPTAARALRVSAHPRTPSNPLTDTGVGPIGRRRDGPGVAHPAAPSHPSTAPPRRVPAFQVFARPLLKAPRTISCVRRLPGFAAVTPPALPALVPRPSHHFILHLRASRFQGCSGKAMAHVAAFRFSPVPRPSPHVKTLR